MRAIDRADSTQWEGLQGPEGSAASASSAFREAVRGEDCGKEAQFREHAEERGGAGASGQLPGSDDDGDAAAVREGVDTEARATPGAPTCLVVDQSSAVEGSDGGDTAEEDESYLEG
jgi:hypothetical protein